VLNCRQFLHEVSDYLDGAADCAEVESHLAACRKCRIVCETTRQTIRLYHRWEGAAELPADVEARLMACLEQRIARG